MKIKLIYFFFFGFVISCSQNINEVDLKNSEGIWTNNGKTYSGSVYRIIKKKKIKLGEIKDGNKIGKWIEFGNIIFRTGKYMQGKRVGKWEGWHSDSAKAYVGYYENNVKIGLWKGWNKNGTLSYSGNFIKGKKDSVWTYWYENKKISDSGSYKDDLMIGLWKFYNTDGTLKEEKDFGDN